MFSLKTLIWVRVIRRSLRGCKVHSEVTTLDSQFQVLSINNPTHLQTHDGKLSLMCVWIRTTTSCFKLKPHRTKGSRQRVNVLIWVKGHFKRWWCHRVFHNNSLNWSRTDDVIQKKNSRVNKVGRPVDRVDDPGGIISQDTGLTCSHRLLPYEPDTHTHTHIFTGIKLYRLEHEWQLYVSRFLKDNIDLGNWSTINNTHNEGGGASYLWVGNFSFTDWMMSCSTFWSVCVTRSTDELFVITFLSSCRASRTTWSIQWSMHLINTVGP